MNWPADRVERRPIEALIPDARNARTHDDAQVAQVAASMREWGWTNPVLVDEGGSIIAGHCRVLAARKLGYTEVPVMVAEGWSKAQKRAYILADNQLALNAGWDMDVLANEMEGLKEWDFDLSLLGFSDLDALLAGKTDGLTDPDDVPEEPAVPVTVAGDVWLLGRHRLVCGDCTTVDVVDAAMAGERASVCLTDPPYGLDDSTSDKNNYDSYEDSRDNLIRAITGFFPLARDVSDIVVVTPGNGNQSLYPPPTWTLGWFIPGAVGRGPWGFCCWQPILCYGKDPKLARGLGCHPDAVVDNSHPDAVAHPCSKPVKLWRWVMERTSEAGERIYDPFSGSGTTVIAAEMTGRACHAIEISPAYVDVAVKRWQAFTGQSATLDRDGRTFAQIGDERRPYDEAIDSRQSYNDAVVAVGERVKAGDPVPAFFRSDRTA